MVDQNKKTPLSAEEISALKGRYKLPEEKQHKSAPQDGYMLGIHFVLSALLPALLGVWVDKMFATAPWGFLSLFLLGLASGFWYLWRKSRSFAESVDEEEE